MPTGGGSVTGSAGVTANMKDWLAPAGMSTGVLTVPVSAFVRGSVVWYRNAPGNGRGKGAIF